MFGHHPRAFWVSTVLWLEGLREKELLAWQKAFTDYLWDVSLADQISSLREIPEALNGRYKSIADTLNRETRIHDFKVLPFTDLHVHEFKGMLEVYAPTLVKIFVHLHGKGTRTAPADETNGAATGFAKDLIRALAEALRKDTLGASYPHQSSSQACALLSGETGANNLLVMICMTSGTQLLHWVTVTISQLTNLCVI